jgi:hypothetical protein
MANALTRVVMVISSITGGCNAAVDKRSVDVPKSRIELTA